MGLEGSLEAGLGVFESAPVEYSRIRLWNRHREHIDSCFFELPVTKLEKLLAGEGRDRIAGPLSCLKMKVDPGRKKKGRAAATGPVISNVWNWVRRGVICVWLQGVKETMEALRPLNSVAFSCYGGPIFDRGSQSRPRARGTELLCKYSVL